MPAPRRAPAAAPRRNPPPRPRRDAPADEDLRWSEPGERVPAGVPPASYVPVDPNAPGFRQGRAGGPVAKVPYRGPSRPASRWPDLAVFFGVTGGALMPSWPGFFLVLIGVTAGAQYVARWWRWRAAWGHGRLL